MSNTLGNCFRITVFGQSHAPSIGVTIEGLPAGIAIDTERLQSFMDRRAPGRDPYSTTRKEADRPEFISGLQNGVTCGSPLTAVIYNTDTRSKDYEALRYVPRPGHADYPAMVKYGEGRDFAGGGQFSGRMTAPICIAGGICLQLLEQMGITVKAKAERIGGETEEEAMLRAIEQARADKDSVGGVIACSVDGLFPGIGEPMFDGMENRIARAVFGIPAVKGIEFGSGFAGSELRGSENNDPYFWKDGKVVTDGNHHGGILGGITTGMPLTFRTAIKPTPSIAKEQDTINIKTGENAKLTVTGRHDPCIVLRAVPCIEAAAAIAVYDAILEWKQQKGE